MKLRIHAMNGDAPDPREWDNTGVMACWHRRYKLGDEQPDMGSQDYIEALPEGTVILPLYLYDHSGISMQTTAFSCPWDSGQVGIIYCTPDSLKEQGIDAEQARRNMVAEVETYSMFLEGRVYGFTVEADPKHCDACDRDEEPEILDSCCGFYGEDWKDNGLADYLPPEVLPQLETVEVEYGS